MLGVKRMPRPLSESRKPESRRKTAVLRGMRLRPIDSPPGFPGQPCRERGEGRVRGVARTGAVQSKSAPTLPRPESRGAWRHRAARTGGGRSVRAAGENRNRRGAPSPSSETGASPDLRQSGRAQRWAFCPAFGVNSERKGTPVLIPSGTGDLYRKSVAFEFAAGGGTRRDA